MLAITQFKKSQKTAWILLSFIYAALSLQTIKADDIDIYTKADKFGIGGEPVMTFVIDTSGSMTDKMSSDNGASNLFEERFFLLQNNLYDQITSMKGTFSVGLFSYNASNASNGTGRKDRDANPLAYFVTPPATAATKASSTYQASHSGSGVYNQAALNDVAWVPGGGLKNGETQLSFPYIQEPGGEVSLGTSVNGIWSNSGGANSDRVVASYDLGGAIAGNKKVKYKVTSNGKQTFWLRRDGNVASPDPYLFIFINGILHSSSNDDAFPGGDGSCGPGETYDKIKDECGWSEQWCQGGSGKSKYWAYKYSGNWWDLTNPCTNKWGWPDTSKVKWRDFTRPADATPADINSRVFEVQLSAGDDVEFVIATKAAGQSGNWTLDNSADAKGYFYTYGPATTKAQSVALHFSAVNVPKGASVSSAVLRFRTASSAGSQNVKVFVDESLTPSAIQGTGLDMQNRDWIGQPTKNVAGQASDNWFTVDVAPLINAKLSQSDWCGGSDLVFMIEGQLPLISLLGPLVVSSEETNNDPQLQINWNFSGGSSCYRKPVSLKPKSIGDDVYQSANGTVTRDTNTIEMGTAKAGLRFSIVNLPNATDANGNGIGLSVVNARLTLKAANTAPGDTVYIQAIDEGVAKLFNEQLDSLNSRALSAPIEWQLEQWNDGSVYESPNLASIIEPLLQRADWEYGGSIGLILTTASNSSRLFYAWEYTASGVSRSRNSSTHESFNRFGNNAAQLNITAESSQPFNSGRTVRQDLQEKLFDPSMRPVHYTPIAGSYVEAAEYMLGKGSYDSPLDVVGTCQSNTLVLLTDGADSSWAGNTNDFKDISGKNCSGNWDCAYKLATALKGGVPWYDTAQPGDDGIRVLKTYTIGYGPIGDSPTGGNLGTLAQQGDGNYYAAKNSTQLAEAFESIIGSISDSGASISVPGVAVSAFNRITLLDEVYYALFKPSTRKNWAGNTKRYRLNNETIVDVNNNDAIDLVNAYFYDEAQSWWSPQADGPIVSTGGSAIHISPVDRKLYTYLGDGPALSDTGAMSDRGLSLASSGVNLMTVSPSSFDSDDVGVGRLSDYINMSAAEVNARISKVLTWIRGGTEDSPRTEMGAPLHSSPVMIGYKETSGDLVSTLFVSTNEGYLHALDAGEPTKGNAQDLNNRGGKELFGFMPRETMRNAALLEENAVAKDGDPHIYGLDLTWTFWREGGDDASINKSSDHVYIYGGMRRGGRMIYGLNVTSAYYKDATNNHVDPRLLFAIGNPNPDEPAFAQTTDTSGDPVTSALKDYKNIGQTWSMPRVRKIMWKGNAETVLLFGGGYDPQHDDPNYTIKDDQIGNQVYMVNATTGRLMWAQSTKYAIPARLRPYDRTGDTFIDSFYAVDLRGRVLRFDLNDSQDGFTEQEIAFVGGNGTSNRKFYSEPSIALLNNPNTGEIDIMVAVSSGYRANPLDSTVKERFYMFFDRGAYSAKPKTPDHLIVHDPSKIKLKEINLATDIATGLSTNPSDPSGIYQIDGWYFDFDNAIKEKGLGSPLIFNGIVTFTAYTNKESGSETCTPVIGSTRVYMMDIAGKGRADIIGGTGAFVDDVSPGLASDVQIITIGESVAILNDKKVIKVEKTCELVNCDGRDLDRSSWTTRSMSATDDPL